MKIKLLYTLILVLLVFSCTDLKIENPQSDKISKEKNTNIISGIWSIDSVTFTSNQFKDTIFIGSMLGFIRFNPNNTGKIEMETEPSDSWIFCGYDTYSWRLEEEKLIFYNDLFETTTDIIDEGVINDLRLYLRIKFCENNEFVPFKFNNVLLKKNLGGYGDERSINK